MKLCKNCNKTKELSEFGTVYNKQYPNKYYHTLCKKCRYIKYVKGRPTKEHVQKWREKQHDNTFKVYMLPNAECYVGYTKAIKPRMYRHKQKGKDYSDYIILHTVKSKEVALALEKMYHNAGFPG